MVAEVIEREAAALTIPACVIREGWRRKQACHLLGLLEMRSALAEAAEAPLVDGCSQPDSRSDVLQGASLGFVIVHVVVANQAHAISGGEGVEHGEATGIVSREQHGAGEDSQRSAKRRARARRRFAE